VEVSKTHLLSWNRNLIFLFPITGSAIVTERGCAHQSLSYRVLKKGTWHTVNDVNETLYEDGCQLEGEQPDAFSHKPPTLYCYCSGRLCNTAGISSKLSLSLLFLAVFIPLSLWYSMNHTFWTAHLGSLLKWACLYYTTYIQLISTCIPLPFSYLLQLQKKETLKFPMYYFQQVTRELK